MVKRFVPRENVKGGEERGNNNGMEWREVREERPVKAEGEREERLFIPRSHG